MRRFLSTNWVYIVVPLAVVAAIVIALVVFGADSGNVHVYTI